MTTRTTDELDQANEPMQQPEFDLERAVEEARGDEENAGLNKVHIDEDVIKEIARRALTRVNTIAPANPGGFGLSRKNPEGVRVTITEEDKRPQISLDAYILVRYGLRIPDVAWDLQEFLKSELERSTGYEVKTVNIFVHGIFFGENDPAETQPNQSAPNDTSEPQGAEQA